MKFGPKAFAAIERWLASEDKDLQRAAIDATVKLISLRIPREVKADVAVSVRDEIRAILTPATVLAVSEAEREALEETWS